MQPEVEFPFSCDVSRSTVRVNTPHCTFATSIYTNTVFIPPFVIKIWPNNFAFVSYKAMSGKSTFLSPIPEHSAMRLRKRYFNSPEIKAISNTIAVSYTHLTLPTILLV